jgi:hypothetical protein
MEDPLVWIGGVGAIAILLLPIWQDSKIIGSFSILIIIAIATHPQNQTAIAQVTNKFLVIAIATHPQN